MLLYNINSLSIAEAEKCELKVSEASALHWRSPNSGHIASVRLAPWQHSHSHSLRSGVCGCVCLCICVYVFVCLYVCDREGERDKDKFRKQLHYKYIFLVIIPTVIPN